MDEAQFGKIIMRTKQDIEQEHTNLINKAEKLRKKLLDLEPRSRKARDLFKQLEKVEEDIKYNTILPTP